MRKVIASASRRIGNIFHQISNKLSPPSKASSNIPLIPAYRLTRWAEDNGDETHRLNYELTEDSIIFDLGGYEGGWSASIFCLYGSFVYVFEPYEDYCKNIERKFQHNKKVKVFQFGLSKDNQVEKLAVADNSSSMFIKSDNNVDIRLVRANDFFIEHNISKIDLMKINIEGGEFNLLEHLIATGDVNKIDNLQVQFHEFIPDAAKRMKAIQDSLQETHELTYQYEFVWENWKRKTGGAV